MKPSPALLGTTDSECTGRPPPIRKGPPGGAGRFVDLVALLDDLPEVAAELPAMPAPVPATTHSAPSSAVRVMRLRVIVTNFMELLPMVDMSPDRASPRASEGSVSRSYERRRSARRVVLTRFLHAT